MVCLTLPAWCRALPETPLLMTDRVTVSGRFPSLASTSSVGSAVSDLSAADVFRTASVGLRRRKRKTRRGFDLGGLRLGCVLAELAVCLLLRSTGDSDFAFVLAFAFEVLEAPFRFGCRGLDTALVLVF